MRHTPPKKHNSIVASVKNYLGRSQVLSMILCGNCEQLLLCSNRRHTMEEDYCFSETYKMRQVRRVLATKKNNKLYLLYDVPFLS